MEGTEPKRLTPARTPEHICAGQTVWGGWGSNPRPRDYEKGFGQVREDHVWLSSQVRGLRLATDVHRNPSMCTPVAANSAANLRWPGHRTTTLGQLLQRARERDPLAAGGWRFDLSRPVNEGVE